MALLHLTKSNYIISQWSGGTTTQLAIAPEGAVYADRDFLWRISSATVDLEESDFTALPDYVRLISVLDGIPSLLLGIVPLALAIMTVVVCIERIHEIKKGEEDDLSKY